MEKNLHAMYRGGYPTEETAQPMFDEYDYQAATQFYIWAYAYLTSPGFEKGLEALGGDERPLAISTKTSSLFGLQEQSTRSNSILVTVLSSLRRSALSSSSSSINGLDRCWAIHQHSPVIVWMKTELRP